MSNLVKVWYHGAMTIELTSWNGTGAMKEVEEVIRRWEDLPTC